MDKIKITNHQLFSLTANGAIGGSVIVISALVASVAKQDAWIGALLTPAFGITVIWYSQGLNLSLRLHGSLHNSL